MTRCQLVHAPGALDMDRDHYRPRKRTREIMRNSGVEYATLGSFALCGPVRVKVGVKDNQTTNTQVTAIMRDVGL